MPIFGRTLGHAVFVGLIAFAPAVFAAEGAAKADAKSAPLDMAKAKQTAETVCAACHTADGNSAIAANPKLAGQHPEYLYKQLHDFKAWNGKPAERVNPVMGGMAAPLEEADMKALAAYFAQQKPKLAAVRDRKTAEQGQQIWRAGIAAKGVPACAACHGPAGAGLPVQYPRLQAQHGDYVEAQLKLFRGKGRTNDASGMMQTIALKMTDEEIKAVSDYVQGLR
ncbi:c-type cytochrome [Niveibacterium sp. SC-1]|uniref:c-type cytochrome n=1 Tax=Niveibacterium sp. SC-1 TaxID=3135646 RepID=UPI00311E0B7F